VGLAVLGRWLLRNRVRLSWSDALVAGMSGAAAGSLVSGVVHSLDASSPLLSAGVAIGVTLLILLAMERWQRARRLPRGSAAELIARGESSTVEFKSSARYNRRTGQRDEKLERVILKTIVAFLNAEGGVLLIGVADDGSVPGIEDDYALMKMPDRDRYELWLRDVLITAVGATAASWVDVAFEQVEGNDVCLVRAQAAVRPVFIKPAKGDAASSFVVRVGNSTRELGVDEALAYCVQRWNRRALSGPRRA
jgi:hypothetical protein